MIGGGTSNLAKGLYAAIPGGWENIAKGMGSLAAGSYAKASHDGSFVWSDYRGGVGGHFESVYPNEFAIRAGGGVRIANQGDGARLLEFQTERPWVFRQHGMEAGAGLELASLDVNGISNKHFLINTQGRIGLGTTKPRGKLHLVHEEEPPTGLAPGNNGLLLGSAGDASYKWIQSYGGPLRINPKGNQVLFGEDFTMTDLHQRWAGWLDRYGKADILASTIFGQNVYASSYLVAETILEKSDRDAKTEFEEVDTTEVLHKVIGLPIETWVYKSDQNGSRHMGPMAQDFRAAFGLGIDDKTIATVDADGVALAAIQGLNQKVEQSGEKIDREIQGLRDSLAEQERRIQDLEASVKSLTALLRVCMTHPERVASSKP